MAGKVRHLVNRSGRYHARLVVPEILRGIVGKRELRTALGGDYRNALKLLPGAVARLQHQITEAEQLAGQAKKNGPARYSMAPDQLAFSLYARRLAFDDELRNDTRYASVGIDDLLVDRLRAAISGRAEDRELAQLVGHDIESFRSSGNLIARPGSTEWRGIARALCQAELEAFARMAERDDGVFSGTPTAPIILIAQPSERVQEPVSIERLWGDYVDSRVQIGAMRDGGRSQRPVFEGLR